MSGGGGVVIAGGGLAAQRCAETLRRLAFEGRVRIVCAEGHLPYNRPPLSKEVLREAAAEDGLAFRAAEWFEEKQVELVVEPRWRAGIVGLGGVVDPQRLPCRGREGEGGTKGG